MNRIRTFALRWLIAPRGLSPDTGDLIARFSRTLAEKLRAAEIKYGYDIGWLFTDDDWPFPECQNELLKHLSKGDPRDVAIYCAFLWHHRMSTSAHKLDVDIQERVVEIIYAFARAQQNREHDCQSTPFTNPDDKVSVNLRGVGEALEAIMKTFGFGVVNIQ